jgi:IS4 transposase
VLFRRIEYWNEDKSEILVFFSNLLHLAASTIAAIYKDRWQVELFFKALKQTPKIKTFVGTSANAVRTQVWTALIAMLVLFRSGPKARVRGRGQSGAMPNVFTTRQKAQES